MVLRRYWQRLLDQHPEKMRQRRETVGHPFGDQGPDGSNPLPDEDAATGAAEMALHVLAYNLTRVMNIMDVRPLLEAMRV